MATSNNHAKAVESLEISFIMGSRAGRNIITHWLTRAGVFTSTFVKDPLEHAYWAGRREMGLEIYNQIKEQAPSEFNLMTKEMNDAT